MLDEIGQMPLPHYITRTLEDKERYQTVYSHEPGSAAAPTAGLHFTEGSERATAEGRSDRLCDPACGAGDLSPCKGG